MAVGEVGEVGRRWPCRLKTDTIINVDADDVSGGDFHWASQRSSFGFIKWRNQVRGSGERGGGRRRIIRRRNEISRIHFHGHPPPLQNRHD